MSIKLKDYQSNVVGGLGTWTDTITVAGLYNIASNSTVFPPSGLSVIINLNGSPIASSAAPSAAEQVVNVQATSVPCAVNDVITVVISSSAANDQILNAVKTIIVLTQTNA